MPQFIIDQQTGEVALSLEHFLNLNLFKDTQRKNCYSIIFLKGEKASLSIDFREYKLEGNHVICLSPYQSFALCSDTECHGFQLSFHPDFFCTYRHQNEVETEGVLFGNFHDLPFFKIVDETSFLNLIDQISNEIDIDCIAQHEVLVSYLKIFLIEAIRQKKKFSKNVDLSCYNMQTEVLQSLMDAINNHYTEKHSPKEYADLLCTSTKTLAGITKKYMNQTLTCLISNRILIEAKRELYLT
ncbi:MAG: AraC family transcriptional regulator, partial [Flavobacteriaceae bacterium]